MSAKYGGNLGKLLNVARILHMKKMKMKDIQKVNYILYQKLFAIIKYNEFNM